MVNIKGEHLKYTELSICKKHTSPSSGIARAQVRAELPVKVPMSKILFAFINLIKLEPIDITLIYLFILGREKKPQELRAFHRAQHFSKCVVGVHPGVHAV